MSSALSSGTEVETFLAIYFKGGSSGWGQTYTDDDCPTPGTNPPLNSHVSDTSTLTTNNGKGYWSSVRQFAFAAKTEYTGSKISGGVEAGGRVQHVDLSHFLKTTDMTSPRLFDCCSTGYQLQHLVLWQPGLNILITFWDVNITGYLVRGSHARTSNFDFTSDSGVLTSAYEKYSMSPLVATSTWEDEVSFNYSAVEYNVNGVIQSWNTEQAVPISSDSSPNSGSGTFPSS